MKRTILLLLTAVLLCSLTACGTPQELNGKYALSVDLYDDVIAAFDGTEYTDTDLSLDEYLSDFILTINYTFYENETYSVALNRDALSVELDELEVALHNVMEARLLANAYTQMAAYGIPLETKEDVEALFGRSVEDLFLDRNGITMEEYIDNTVNECFYTILDTGYTASGKFSAAEGVLILSDSLSSELPTDRYEYYEIDSDGSIIFTAGTNIPEDELFSYPYVLTPVR